MYDVFKMDAISHSLSAYVTHPEYSKIEEQMLEDSCGIDADLFMRFEASLSPAARGNLLDVVGDLQFNVDFSDASERFIESVQRKMVIVLDDRRITAAAPSFPLEMEMQDMDLDDEGAQSCFFMDLVDESSYG